jgi:hypothetical protein
MVYIDTADKRGWSHLIATSIEELHKFAIGIGLKREWFQDKPGHPHYDVGRTLRKIAITNGAKSISKKELVLVLEQYYALQN